MFSMGVERDQWHEMRVAYLNPLKTENSKVSRCFQGV